MNVEEGRHLWAMVYLLHSYFGRDGRDEAEELLERQSGNRDKPRILDAFNEPIDNWLDFFMFTMFTDRDGKSQLLSLSESSLDPLSRTTRFMLTEEAHHMFVGETGVARIIERTCQLMKEAGFSEDVRKLGGIDLPTIQKYINLWFSLSLDLHGNEISTNAASYFANGLKGRAQEEKWDDHLVTEQFYELEVAADGRLERRSIPMRTAMNEVLRDWYVGDCAGRRRALEQDPRAARHVGSPAAARSQVQPRHRHVLVAALRSAGRAAVRRGVGAAQARVAAVTRRSRVPPQHHGGAGLRARQVRQLHRAAAPRHQPAADQLRVRPDGGVRPAQSGPSRFRATPCRFTMIGGKKLRRLSAAVCGSGTFPAQ